MTIPTLVLATLTLVSDPLAGRLCGKGPTPPEGYSPPMISNGDLNMLVEWTGGQSGTEYNKMRTTVYWQGRRGPARDAALFAFGRFNPTMEVEGRRVGLPSAWSQTLDIRTALVTCEGAFDVFGGLGFSTGFGGATGVGRMTTDTSR